MISDVTERLHNRNVTERLHGRWKGMTDLVVLHINYARSVDVRGSWECPATGKRERHLLSESDNPYYAPWVYCECGDVFNEGGRVQRPFRRGWRAEAQRGFAERWATAQDALPRRCDNCLHLNCVCKSGDQL